MRLSLGFVASLFVATASALSTGRFWRRESVTASYNLAEKKLDTEWTSKVGTNPWPEYPRPLLERSNWKNLNGVWQYKNVTNGSGFYSPPFGENLPQSVLVPFCLESQLSGVGGDWMLYSFYRTHFDVPSSWPSKNRVLLNFGAVDYKTHVYVNGKNTSAPHVGGYDTFSYDITELVNKNGTNELFVAVFDPTDHEENGVQVQVPIGKQTLWPEHIFYTPCSGIWQTVWLESAPSTYVKEMHVTADMNGKLDVTVKTNDGSSQPVNVFLFEPQALEHKGNLNFDAAVFKTAGSSDQPFSVVVKNIEQWSPDSPTLYPMAVKVGDDTFKSYVGFRTISRGEINGVQRPLVNGKFIFQIGTLDQGFWPDGIYSPPSVEAMRYDLVKLKEIGYNMVRKHIKVEPALWYKACDELGLLVIQDMPSLKPTVRDPKSSKPKECVDNTPVGSPEATEEFGRQLEAIVQQLKNYPSIATWMIYNENWGQPRDNDTAERVFTERVKQLDPTRLVNTVSGWHDHGYGDFHDNHHYANPQCGTPFYSDPGVPYDQKRIALQGEFAGIGHNLSAEHLWPVQDAKRHIKFTYELDATIEDWNYRAHVLLSELRGQIERYACSGAVWTQTTDVEGEVNGMLSYDRRIFRPNIEQWRNDIRALHEAAKKRGGEMVKVGGQ